MNRRSAILLGIGLPAAAIGVAQRRDAARVGGLSNEPLARDEGEKRILGVISEVMRSGNVFLSVTPGTGRTLRVLTEIADAKRVAEIGTSTGYSGLWLVLALRRTGGKLTTFEIHRARAEMARKHFAQAGVDQLVTVVEGDAHEKVKQLKEPLDVVFLDADKEGYVSYLNQLLPLVRSGGVILADNVSRAPDYVRAVTTNPNLETIALPEFDEDDDNHAPDFAVTMKKR